MSRTAEGFIVGSAITKATFNGNLVEVVTGKFDGKYNPGADGGRNLSIPEILGFTASGWKAQNVGGRYGKSWGTSFPNAVWENMKANGLQSAATIIATPVIFRTVRKTARPFIRQFNAAMRMVGLPVRF